MSAPRRNEPCPCGSGRRYKDCHGKLGGDAPDANALARRALSAHRAGRIDEAASAYSDILSREPSNAIATHYLGLIDWQRGDLARGEERMRASITSDPTVPDFHNNLGLLLRDTGRRPEAVDRFRAALEADPAWIEAYSNLGLALEGLGRWEEAIAAYRAAVSREPRFAAARQNLARALLTRGQFAEGWREYRWRLLAQGLSSAPPDAGVTPLPASLEGRRFALLAEQGVGDILFFLRFAAEIKRRGGRAAFRGDPRLHSMIARTGLLELGVAAAQSPAEGLEPVYIGDLPWLLGVENAASAPAPLALAPEAQRVERMRAALQAHGPSPSVALTWRAGLASQGPSRTQLKEIDPEALGKALRGRAASWISVQRLPREGERERLAEALGAPVLDMSAANTDLEDMLALLAIVDDYVGVSNANTHLRAGVAKPMQVLIPNPPEWRWGLAGRSPWFASARLYRQDSDGDWTHALARLASESSIA